MAAGKLNLQAADGAVIGLVVPDGLTSGERQISLGVNLSGITAYHLLQGNLAVSNEVLTNGFSTTLYTGTGASQSVNAGIDMDTQLGNDASEKFGGLVWLKNRDTAAYNNLLFDSIRGVTNYIMTNSTAAQAVGATMLTSFGSNGFTLGSYIEVNGTSKTNVSWSFQTTHRRTGMTNHGKAYTEHYNPFTGFTIVKYEGSGVAGHKIPHMLGRKLGFATFKNLTTDQDWLTYYGIDNMYMAQNLTISGTAGSVWSNQTDNAFKFDSGGTQFNQASSQHVMYGWANSYFDESNKLIGNYEIGVYQGTGVAGKKVTTKGKPAWIMIKRLDSTGDWAIKDNLRGSTKLLYANASVAEETDQNVDFSVDGFIIQNTNTDMNASGGQYLYMVVYDNDSGSGKSKYPRATDTSNVQINNALIPLAQGIDSNGAKNTILSKNETITGLTYTQGKNYVYCDKNGGYGVTPYKPRYLESELVRTYASEQPDYFSIADNKWYSCDAGSELISNGTFDVNTTGWTTTTGFAISIQNGTLKIDRNIATPTGGVYQNITTTVGKKYRLTLDINYISGGGVSVWVDSGNTLSSYITVLGKQLIEFTAVNSSTKIEFLQIGVAGTGTINIDTVTCFPTDITPTTEITNSRNYLNHIVHADNDGGVLYVEELPKIEYKDIVKANEFKGKNACTAWVNFDGTTTPPTIRDSYNVSAIIRTAYGIFDVYFKELMDNNNFVMMCPNSTYSNGGFTDYSLTYSGRYQRYLHKITIIVSNGSAGINDLQNDIFIIGGKN